MFTLIDSIPVWFQISFFAVALMAICIASCVILRSLPKLTILGFVLIYIDGIFLVIYKILARAKYSLDLIKLFQVLFIVAGISWFILLTVQGYRTVFRYDQKQKKIFWIYVIGFACLLTFTIIFIIHLNLAR